MHAKCAVSVILCTAMIMLSSIPAFGEIYKYVDNEGIVHYTDNQATIPQEYRKGLDRHMGIKSHPVPTRPVAVTVSTRVKPSPSQASAHPSAKKKIEPAKPLRKAVKIVSATRNNEARLGPYRMKRKSLLKKSVQLDQEYQILLRQREQLQESRNGLDTSDEIQSYNESVQQLNKKIRAYREKRKTLETEIKSFNNSLRDNGK